MLVLHRRHLWLPCCCYSDLGFPPNLNNAAQDSTFLSADPCSHAHHPRSNLRRIPRRAPPRIRIRTVGRDWGGDYDRLEGAPEWRPSHCGGALGPSATSSPAAAVRKLDSGGCEPVRQGRWRTWGKELARPLSRPMHIQKQKSAHLSISLVIGRPNVLVHQTDSVGLAYLSAHLRFWPLILHMPMNRAQMPKGSKRRCHSSSSWTRAISIIIYIYIFSG